MVETNLFLKSFLERNEVKLLRNLAPKFQVVPPIVRKILIDKVDHEIVVQEALREVILIKVSLNVNVMLAV